MNIHEDLRDLARNIIKSYEIRVITVSTLMNQANRVLKTFQMEIEQMIMKLRDNLAKSESLRKKDFDHMISDVIERHRMREEEADQDLKLFKMEEEEMISHLKRIIVGKTKSSLEDIKAIREDILRRQKKREKRIIQTLKQFHIEHEELKTGFKRLLLKGERVKIKDFKTMLKSLKVQQNHQNAELNQMMEEFEAIRDRVQTQWQMVSRANTL